MAGVQMQEENPVRGYFSSVDRQLIFGLGKIIMLIPWVLYGRIKTAD